VLTRTLRGTTFRLRVLHGDCARNESDRASVVYSCGEDVKGEEGAGRGPGDPESRAGSRGQGHRDVRGDAGIA